MGERSPLMGERSPLMGERRPLMGERAASESPSGPGPCEEAAPVLSAARFRPGQRYGAPCSLRFSEVDAEPKSAAPRPPPRTRTRSHQDLAASSSGSLHRAGAPSGVQPSPSPSLTSLQSPERPPRTKDKTGSQGLQRHASAPALEIKIPPGRSPKLGLMKIFRRQSWTGHSYAPLETPGLGPTLGEIMAPDTPTMTLRKKMRASASSLTKLFRSSSKEDLTKGGEGT